MKSYQPKNKVRFLTATSLFDGHDAAINIFRRMLQASGAEVIHLGHNRSVNEIVEAAIEEDVQGIAVSCYQGGHMEFFKYMIDLLKKEGAGHIKVFGGGGGVIISEEAKELERYGVSKIFTPEDGRLMGLKGMVHYMLREADFLTFDGIGEKAIVQLSPDKKMLIASLILKEDQGQNTCIFSTEFALRMMGDIQEYFVENTVNNFYSVSISGYHIAEAGANPITQLAFTLANGFTYLEYYLSRGLKVDDVAPNFSFFFSNGLDPEYTVIGRVARRIWAIALREKYGANERSQKLKYHIQTSGRSLHAQEIQFNDIRTTLQALSAIYDNCNSLHTNSYNEAITTPTEESVRRALAIQLIINREWGLAKNENSQQGSFIIEALTDLVEEAVLKEFERISERGGVLGAMEWGYQRSKIQDESLLYEQKKHSGELPIVGVNTFLNPDVETRGGISCKLELSRSTEEEKKSQLRRLREFRARHKDETPHALERLKKVAIEGGNIFAELMKTVRVCSLGQITQALYEVGGRYRRNI